MELSLAHNCHIQKQTIGIEKSPILIIDNFVEQAQTLVEHASKLTFEKNSPFYPGIRAEAFSCINKYYLVTYRIL